MINAVGRDIPENILEQTGKDIFRGSYYCDNRQYTKAAPTVRAFDRGAWLIICWINYFITLNGWERSLELSCMVISIKARSMSLR